MRNVEEAEVYVQYVSGVIDHEICSLVLTLFVDGKEQIV